MDTKETRHPECVQCITGEEILWNCMRTVSLGQWDQISCPL